MNGTDKFYVILERTVLSCLFPSNNLLTATIVWQTRTKIPPHKLTVSIQFANSWIPWKVLAVKVELMHHCLVGCHIHFWFL